MKVRIAPTTVELLTQRAEYVPGQGVPLFELRPPVVAGLDWAVKRAFDIVVSGLLITVALPAWALIALAVKLDSPGPVFYRDRRIGLGEAEFGMFKFRSMYVDAGERQAALEIENEASGPLFKIKDDPRVTTIGRFLRRYSVDEMPQVLNVLRGEMSLVGPRPLPLRDYVQLEEWHRKRYRVLPGMTGLWQVSGRIDLSFDDLVRLDFYYLENWSIWLDISILAKTLPAVVARRGAYSQGNPWFPSGLPSFGGEWRGGGGAAARAWSRLRRQSALVQERLWTESVVSSRPVVASPGPAAGSASG